LTFKVWEMSGKMVCPFLTTRMPLRNLQQRKTPLIFSRLSHMMAENLKNVQEILKRLTLKILN